MSQRNPERSASQLPRKGKCGRENHNFNSLRAAQLATQATHHLAEQIPHDPTRRSRVQRALLHTLFAYQDVMPVNFYESFLKYLTTQPLNTVFVDPQNRDAVRRHLPTRTEVLDNFPVITTTIPEDKAGTSRVRAVIADITQRGGIAFRQSSASALPSWMIERQMLEGSLAVGDTVKIVDLCGAPGNKTLNLLFLPGVVDTTAVINDRSSTRLQRLETRLQELFFEGSGNGEYTRRFPDGRNARIYLTNFDATDPTAVDQTVDRCLKGKSPNIVIADVECPGDGRLQVHPSFGTRYLYRSVEETLSQQRILQNASDVVAYAGSGLVVYSTCSVSPIVNEAVVEAVVVGSKNLGFVDIYVDDRVVFRPVFEYKGIRLDSSIRGARTFPGNAMQEGFFCSLI